MGLGMTPFFRVIPSVASPLYRVIPSVSEGSAPPPVSSRAKRGICTPSRVIPSVSEGSAVGNGARGGRETRRDSSSQAPRNDRKGGLLGMTPFSVSSRAKRGICTPFPCHPERSEGSAVRNGAGGGRETRRDSSSQAPRNDRDGPFGMTHTQAVPFRYLQVSIADAGSLFLSFECT